MARWRQYSRARGQRELGTLEDKSGRAPGEVRGCRPGEQRGDRGVEVLKILERLRDWRCHVAGGEWAQF